jgi:hypothetical protein
MSRRPDGLLNHNVLEDDKGPQDACGVFGVWAPGEEVAKLAFYGLYALQHRGQELGLMLNQLCAQLNTARSHLPTMAT